jgi:hypothetical protein
MIGTKGYWLALVSLPLMIAGALSPWVATLGGRVDGSHDEFVLLLAIVAAFMLIFLAASERRWLATFPLLAGLTAAALTGNDIHDIADFAPRVSGRFVSVEWGIYLALFGSTSLVLASVLLFVKTTRTRAGAVPVPRQRKWWLENIEERPRTDADDLQRLARANANAAVLVEVAVARHVDGDATDHAPAKEASPCGGPRVKKRLLNEAHRRQYGRPWGMGRYLFDFVCDAGLRPEHRLLDFGCGALRLGIWVIPYLETGNYFGVDSHLLSLEAAATYEIPLHRLEQKRPRLLWNDDFALSHFGTDFDYIVDFSSSSQVRGPARRRRVFSSFAEVLTPGGRLLTSPRPRSPRRGARRARPDARPRRSDPALPAARGTRG